MAYDFTFQSKAGFDNCVGCINGMLLWMEKPFQKHCKKVGEDSGKFYCGRKGIFGLNMQGVCNAQRRFTYISIQHPASASDYLAFVTSSLYQKLTEGTGLPDGYCLYGDNAYVNETYMAVPFPKTKRCIQLLPIPSPNQHRMCFWRINKQMAFIEVPFKCKHPNQPYECFAVMLV